MAKEIQILDVEDNKKPVLELKEFEEIHFISKQLEVTEKDNELKKFLQNKKINLIETKKGIQVSAGPYIGSAEFSNFILTINPKFSSIQNIGKLIDYAYDLRDEDILDYEIKFNEHENNPMELIIQLFVNQCRKLVEKGLAKSYKIYSDTIPFMKGKLILQQQIKNQSKFNLNFSCEFDEYTENILENQILLYTLNRCYYMTENQNRKSSIKRIIHQMDEEIELKNISQIDFNKIYYTRLNSQYKKPHDLAKLILRELGLFDFKKQSASFVVPYFIPMYKVFEDFLTKIFQEYYPLRSQAQFPRAAWKVNGISKDIIPDIITYNTKSCSAGTEVSIIDAKYMLGNKFGKEKEDYQIAFYLNEYKKNVGYAVLPMSNDNSEDMVREWFAPNQNLRIYVKFVNIDDILELIYSQKDNSDKISQKIQEIIPTTN